MSMDISDSFTFDPSGLRSGRVRRVYNEKEREIIDVYKIQYMEAGSPAARKQISQVFIFPAIFDYWIRTGVVIDDIQMQLRSDVSLSMQSEEIYIIRI
jgi:hypothetical protein